MVVSDYASVQLPLAVLENGSSARAYCTGQGTTSLQSGIAIAYEIYTIRQQQAQPCEQDGEQPERMVMIMGFAAKGDAWLPNLAELLMRAVLPCSLEVCVVDNRGVGGSSVPKDKAQYSTRHMAQDALGVMDHLHWPHAHVVGHSMGAMVSARMALMAPQRVRSLTLISATGGGMEAIPFNWTAIRTALFAGKGKDPAARAAIDLIFHFSPKLLQYKDPGSGMTVRELLIADYASSHAAGGMQQQAGQDGQAHAVLSHKISKQEYAMLRQAPFPIKVLHGLHDIVAAPRHAARLAARLAAPLVMLESAHFMTRDCAREVNDEILASIEAAMRQSRYAEVVHGPSAYKVSSISCLCC